MQTLQAQPRALQTTVIPRFDFGVGWLTSVCARLFKVMIQPKAPETPSKILPGRRLGHSGFGLDKRGRGAEPSSVILQTGLCGSLRPPEGISQSAFTVDAVDQIFTSSSLVCLRFSPGQKGNTSLCPPGSQQCAMRAQTSLWLRSTSALQLELLLADSGRISSGPLSCSFRPGPIVPPRGGEMHCNYVMQTGARYS